VANGLFASRGGYREPFVIQMRICANVDRYAFSIPLPCYVPKKIEALRGQSMKPSTRDEIKGTFHDLKGKVKEKAGQLVNDSYLQAEGHAETRKVQRGIAKTAEMHDEFAPDLGKE
jgi:uncharacterized protein YjbJ (UPF0337 family)